VREWESERVREWESERVRERTLEKIVPDITQCKAIHATLELRYTIAIINFDPH
jgi:hypothetical protein